MFIWVTFTILISFILYLAFKMWVDYKSIRLYNLKVNRVNETNTFMLTKEYKEFDDYVSSVLNLYQIKIIDDSGEEDLVC